MNVESKIMREILSATYTRIAISVLLGFAIGSVFMAVFNENVVATYETLFSNPGLTLQTAGQTIVDGYGALFKGSIINLSADNPVSMFRPITETLRLAAPLIMAGLGVALGFRVGLFNVGGTGQLVMGLLGATWVSTRMELPYGLHMVLALVVAIVFSMGTGALVGFLKARTGAHEVIVTIMMNYIALDLFTWFLRTPGLLLEEGGGGNPKSDPPALTAQLPRLLGDEFKLNIGILLALVAALVYWWLMERSTIGYRFRMVGHNSNAARAAGISVERTYVWAMAASAAFIGIAAANQGLGETGGLTSSIQANIGFDAITVALLGGSRAGGVVIAGLVFGAFKAGSPSMQIIGVSPEVLGIIQALIVLFIAAPPLIRAVFHLPKPEAKQ
jgi:simple sugar transport system permease protein